MKILIAGTLGVLLLSGCAAEQTSDVPAGNVANTTDNAQPAATQTIPTDSAIQPATNENHESGTWTGQVKVAQPVSMFNYVGSESGDFAPMRFRNDSDAGRKILATCSNDDTCEFSGAVEWLDEPPPPDASAIGQIVRVDSVKRLPAAP
jgi:hypothetical protein